MEYEEEEYLLLSGLQHFAFCRRQWALIHIEQQWQENERTVKGELFHKHAHDVWATEKRGSVIVSRGLAVKSKLMGLTGACDIIEFTKCEEGVPLFGHRGLYEIYPIEYKRGKPKDVPADILQLAAQAMCLEEMLSANIREGAIFYGETRHRERVSFTEEIREQVKRYTEEMHQLYDRHYTPKVKWSKSCNACSLKEICMPRLGKAPSVKTYIQEKLKEGFGAKDRVGEEETER